MNSIRKQLEPMFANLRHKNNGDVDNNPNRSKNMTSPKPSRRQPTTNSFVLDENCTSCLPLTDGLCGVSAHKSNNKNNAQEFDKHLHRSNSRPVSTIHISSNPSLISSQAQSSFAFPNATTQTLQSTGTSSTNDTQAITSRIPFFWRSHPNSHLQKKLSPAKNENKTSIHMMSLTGNVKTLFEHDRVHAFDEAKIVYSPTNGGKISLISKPSDELSHGDNDVTEAVSSAIKQKPQNEKMHEILEQSNEHSIESVEESTAKSKSSSSSQQKNVSLQLSLSQSSTSQQSHQDSDDTTAHLDYSESVDTSTKTTTTMLNSSSSSATILETLNMVKQHSQKKKNKLREEQKNQNKKKDVWFIPVNNSKDKDLDDDNTQTPDISFFDNVTITDTTTTTTTQSQSFAEEMGTQMHLFPEFNITSTIASERKTMGELKLLSLSPIPTSTQNHWESFSDFPTFQN